VDDLHLVIRGGRCNHFFRVTKPIVYGESITLKVQQKRVRKTFVSMNLYSIKVVVPYVLLLQYFASRSVMCSRD
jgi:hypothetical protein